MVGMEQYLAGNWTTGIRLRHLPATGVHHSNLGWRPRSTEKAVCDALENSALPDGRLTEAACRVERKIVRSGQMQNGEAPLMLFWCQPKQAGAGGRSVLQVKVKDYTAILLAESPHAHRATCLAQAHHQIEKRAKQKDWRTYLERGHVLG